jgi:hypothetical protein
VVFCGWSFSVSPEPKAVGSTPASPTSSNSIIVSLDSGWEKPVKKWIVPFLSLSLVLVLVYLSGPFNFFKITVPTENQRESGQRMLAQSADKDDREEKRDKTDLWVQILLQVQEKLDAWLKSINERIESQDVSRIEVRFLEILRNVLEWIKGKVDGKIESSRGKSPPKKGGVFQETKSRDFLLVMKG